MNKLYLLLVLACFQIPQLGYGFDNPARIKVFLNPDFGGKNAGPAISKQYSSKDITLKFAERLKHELETDRITVYISRTKDVSILPRESIALAKKLNVNLYIGVTVSKGTQSCIVYRIPGLALIDKPNKSVEDIKEEILLMAKRDDSLAIAGKMSLSTKGTYDGCIKIEESSSRALTLEPHSAILVDFVLSGASDDALLSIVTSELKLDDLSKSIAQSIKDIYFDDRMRSPMKDVESL